jgi:hypothetical protein
MASSTDVPSPPNRSEAVEGNSGISATKIPAAVEMPNTDSTLSSNVSTPEPRSEASGGTI